MEKLLHGDTPLRLRAKESVTFFLSHHALHVLFIFRSTRLKVLSELLFQSVAPKKEEKEKGKKETHGKSPTFVTKLC